MASRDRSNKMLSNCFDVEEMERSRTATSSLVLNFSPVQFEDAELTVARLPNGKDGEQVLKQLRDAHNGNHVFRRKGPGPRLGRVPTPDPARTFWAPPLRCCQRGGLPLPVDASGVIPQSTRPPRAADGP